ncbi:hypothetical protein N7495_002051 [Penicillium taxi]|uniref:uncharacterized protein n=1 Tax=Penicillium taxi TaxID=168475 RepID=UPI0025454BCA|nr:uncharacterized protein N7495_002051 [Penicillium taxi]KAJ5901523.1 hypothetical protein N7495_002051 [Penicillium taxi]
MSNDKIGQPATDLDDEPYDSADDEDFQLDDVQDDSELSADETEPAKKKRKTDTKEEVAAEGLDSGDEVTIRKARDKKNKRKGKKAKGKNALGDDDLDFDDDEEGTGGFVRTRAMRLQIQEDNRKPLAKLDGATVDVDALWEQMNATGNELGLLPNQIAKKETAPEPDRSAEDATSKDNIPDSEAKLPDTKDAQQMIKIKRTYKFAGEMITEEKMVARDSAEAKAFLSSEDNVDGLGDVAADARPILRRPLRKISRFDPNPTGTIQKSWEKQVVEENPSGPKINTVEKSRLDWAQYVDKAGIKDELRVHSRAKEGYMGRMDFLGRVEAKKDDEARQARLKGP